MIRAVIFDVGGVLHTSEDDPVQEKNFALSVLQTLSENGISLNISPEDLIAAVDKRAKEYKKHSEQDLKELPPARVWSEFFLKDFSLTEKQLAPCAERLCFLYDGERKQLVPRPGMKEALGELKAMGMKLGIISNILSPDFVHDRLKRYGLADYMDSVVTSMETGIRKPDKHIFEIATEKLSLVPSECAYVGDRISRDVIGSHNAGMAMVILIRYPASEKKDARFVSPENEPDYRVDGFPEIPALIHNANRRAQHA
ncbi:hydrolase [Treponema primitia ZAS-2]|uniref:Hydrolase n=1 Tax=Treponema primitia (strain ATCC BAA-887 / DSM 12427 / ZAS-2) TaxID=545694 RepID=F5YKF6_TREPZ|nr:HAD family hydrolase [Treponema primitia]AEF85135.1 hydrolase [Treponema primitia ZAS-2]